MNKIKEFYKKYKEAFDFIFTFIIAFIVVYILLLIFIGDPIYLRNSKKLLDSYEYKLDSALKVNDSLTKQVKYFQSKDSFYINEINKNKGKTEIINRYYYEKIHNVDNFDILNIEQFFADRYRDSIK